MKKIILNIVLLNSLTFSAFSQSFQKTYDVSGGADGRGIAVRQTSDGGYIIGGEYDGGISDFHIIKTDGTGVLQWDKKIGGLDDDDILDIQQTSDGGYVMTGSTKSFGAGLTDVYVVKLDASGNLSWSGAYGGANYDVGTTIMQTSDGGYIITGWTSSFGAGGEDLYLVKLNSNGSLTWNRTVGGSNNDEGYSVAQTTDGGYIVSGNTKSFGAGDKDVYLVKFNSGGNVSWTKTFGGANSDFSRSLKQTTDGGYIIGATTNGLELCLIKTDANGTLQWNKIYTESGCGGNTVLSVVQTSDGGYAFTGNIVNCVAGAQNISLIKTDGAGSITWSKAYGGAVGDFTHGAMQQTSDNGFIITGDTRSLASSGTWDIYLIKTDAVGYSGCHQSNVIFNVSSPTLTINSGGTSNSGGVKTTANTSTVVPTTTLTPLCLYYPEGGVGIQELTMMTNVNVYPNPTTNQNITLKINSLSDFDSNIELNDMYGRKVYEKNEKITFGENLVALNTSTFPSGLIIATITNISNAEQLKVKFINQ